MANCIQCGRKLPALSFSKKICQWCVQHEAAQRGEEPENAVQRVEVPPWLRSQSSSMTVTHAIFGINVAVFLGMLFAGVSILDNPSGRDLVRFGANYGPFTLGGQWWRLLTCVFVHGGFFHIAINMWSLWNLGALAEPLYGSKTFSVLYLITGVAASVTSVAWNPNVLSVGASGALFGIIGALIASLALGGFSLPRAHIRGALMSLVLFGGYSLAAGATLQRIDNAAHVGGLVSGLVLGALIAGVAPSRDETFRRAGVLLVGVLLVAGGVMWLQGSQAYLVHAQNGVALLHEGRTDEAIVELRKSVRLRTDFAAAHGALARAYITKREFENAAAEMNSVIALNPRNAVAYYSLGMIYLEEKLPTQAQDAFAQLLRVNPNSADGHAGLAAVFSSENRYSEALEEYKRAAQFDSEYQSVYYHMGLMQSKLKLYDDAIASFLKQRENEDDPDNEQALAHAYEAKGMQREAADAKQRAAQFQGQP